MCLDDFNVWSRSCELLTIYFLLSSIMSAEFYVKKVIFFRVLLLRILNKHIQLSN
jgi:hypothetical protein